MIEPQATAAGGGGGGAESSQQPAAAEARPTTAAVTDGKPNWNSETGPFAGPAQRSGSTSKGIASSSNRVATVFPPNLRQYFDPKFEPRLLGAGGMGSVWEMRTLDSEGGLQVAVKVVLEDSPAHILDRFATEGDIVARLNHPHILPTKRLIKEGDRVLAIVSQLMTQSLADAVKSGTLSLWQVFQIAIQSSRALTSAHNKGLIHRDVKPSNVLLDEEGNGFVADFGLAREIERQSGLTETGTILGTLQYMSPEQACGEQIDGRADIYSLCGTILYALSGGIAPIANGAYAAMSAAILTGEAATRAVDVITNSCPWIPLRIKAHLAGLIAKGLACKASDRQQTMDELTKELEKLFSQLNDEERAQVITVGVSATGAVGGGSLDVTTDHPNRVMELERTVLLSKLYFTRHPLLWLAGIAAVLLLLISFAAYFLPRPTAAPPAPKPGELLQAAGQQEGDGSRETTLQNTADVLLSFIGDRDKDLALLHDAARRILGASFDKKHCEYNPEDPSNLRLDLRAYDAPAIKSLLALLASSQGKPWKSGDILLNSEQIAQLDNETKACISSKLGFAAYSPP